MRKRFETLNIVSAFYDALYKNKTAADQNAFLNPFMVPYAPTRQQRKPGSTKTRTSIQYIIRKQDGSLVTICAATFKGITRMSKLPLR